MLRLGGRQTVGMDVDRGAIKAVQVAATPEGYVLTHVGYHRLPDGVIVDGAVADGESLADEIRAFWDLHSFKGKSVVLGVAGSNVIVRFVDFPRLSAEDLGNAMSFHAEEHIPMPIDEVVLDHIVLGPSKENPEEDRVLLVGAHRELISGYTTAMKSGGLRPTGIDVKALSLTRSTLPDALFDDEETVLLMDVGTEMTNLVVVEGNAPALAQFVPIGFQDFVRAVGETSGLEDDQAEKQATNPAINISPLPEGEEPPEQTADPDQPTRHLTILPRPDDTRDDEDPETRDETPRQAESDVAAEDEGDDGPLAEEATSPESEVQAEAEEESPTVPLDPALVYDVRRGLEDAATRLARDVQRSVEYHNSRPGAKEVSRVVLSGEGALVRGLGAYLGELLGLRTEPGRPSAKLSGNRSNVSDEQLAAMEPVLAVALGLAMEEE